MLWRRSNLSNFNSSQRTLKLDGFKHHLYISHLIMEGYLFDSTFFWHFSFKRPLDFTIPNSFLKSHHHYLFQSVFRSTFLENAHPDPKNAHPKITVDIKNVSDSWHRKFHHDEKKSKPETWAKSIANILQVFKTMKRAKKQNCKCSGDLMMLRIFFVPKSPTFFLETKLVLMSIIFNHENQQSSCLTKMVLCYAL